MKKAKTTVTAYDPEWLVALVQKELPTKPEIAEALKLCTQCVWESEAYVHFVHTPHTNKIISFAGTGVILEDPKRGMIVIDTCANGSIAGVEFLDVVLGENSRSYFK